ncbi:hypothetical protein [Methanohalophilus portucalensis]|uniref:Uncharacterized protein n=2 Tax=Methanohalophilus portucalensis TaxID=39664 RepID=A0A1L9C4R7_9EURY|nr:hypothetical protein [Methanohalophilus portucalensis]ATU08222.1 hypothetical protein BKM01_05230 [Methanohalophilus portucalensis]OJH49529.1 hypothetical protein MPF_0317 [Methanohalophilus portucalensis FDF-1]RNI13613.1 hypothetical protein EFE41_03295 [Methanohalophilus portucalensis FDF-1]SMH35616.1 hypothetical protein SAMN06264941_1016 [Methanohalophilus portucalensis FDF-1]
MLGIFGLIAVAVFIVFLVGLTVKVWMNKTYSGTKKVFLSLAVLLFMIVLVYGLFFFVLVDSDQASYYTTGGKHFEDIDNEMILENAKEADYQVQGPFYVNVRPQDSAGIYPDDLPELEQHLGTDYILKFSTYYYNADKIMEIFFIAEDETIITFFNYSRPDPYFSPFKVEHLPDDRWMIDRMIAVFGFDEQTARSHLQEMKTEIENENRPKMEVARPIVPSALYADLQKMSTSSNFSLTYGEGNTALMFYEDERLAGKINCVVPNHRIVHETDEATYTVKVDKLGGVDLYVELAAGERIPEETYTAGFKKMFRDIGLPEAAVEEYEFNYSSSAW